MSEHAVKVSGIPPSTTEDGLRQFFGFCGKVIKVNFKESGNASIYFEKPSAISTALMLNGGTLDGATLTITEGDRPEEVEEQRSPHVEQPVSETDKSRAGNLIPKKDEVLAELLAKGYELSDSILQRAIDLDSKLFLNQDGEPGRHLELAGQSGISKRLLGYFHSIDQSVGQIALGHDHTVSGSLQEQFQKAAQRVRAFDEEKGISQSAREYSSKIISNPFGHKIQEFFTNASKQISDIHEEAKYIANSHRSQ